MDTLERAAIRVASLSALFGLTVVGAFDLVAGTDAFHHGPLARALFAGFVISGFAAFFLAVRAVGKRFDASMGGTAVANITRVVGALLIVWGVIVGGVVGAAQSAPAADRLPLNAACMQAIQHAAITALVMSHLRVTRMVFPLIALITFSAQAAGIVAVAFLPDWAEVSAALAAPLVAGILWSRWHRAKGTHP